MSRTGPTDGSYILGVLATVRLHRRHVDIDGGWCDVLVDNDVAARFLRGVREADWAVDKQVGKP